MSSFNPPSGVADPHFNTHNHRGTNSTVLRPANYFFQGVFSYYCGFSKIKILHSRNQPPHPYPITQIPANPNQFPNVHAGFDHKIHFPPFFIMTIFSV